jgi:hypothetical protein
LGYRETRTTAQIPAALRMQFPVYRLVASKREEVHKSGGGRQISRLGWLAQGKAVILSGTAVTEYRLTQVRLRASGH